MKDEKLYYAIPLIVLRKFVEMNKDFGDNFMQILEIDPTFLFTEEEITQKGELKSNGIVIVDLNKLKGDSC